MRMASCAFSEEKFMFFSPQRTQRRKLYFHDHPIGLSTQSVVTRVHEWWDLSFFFATFASFAVSRSLW
jgi:hypothetical protein